LKFWRTPKTHDKGMAAYVSLIGLHGRWWRGRKGGQKREHVLSLSSKIPKGNFVFFFFC
jgi:hypothetical protein